MASQVFDSFLDDVLNNNIDVKNGTFYAILIASANAPNRGTATKRSDLTEITGTNYPAGGVAVTLTISKDATNHRNQITISDPTFANVTATARYCAVYQRLGGLASADPLVMFGDAGADYTRTAEDFVFDFTTPYTIQH